MRGRGTSSAPRDVVERSAEKAGIPIPGEGDEQDNRLAGLGPLSGAPVGVGVDAVAGLTGAVLRKRDVSVSAPVRVLVLAATAMALADVSMELLDISDPTDWAAKEWAADALPHLVYGATTFATLLVTDQR